MNELSIFVAMSMSALLLWAGLEKLRNLRSTSGMLRALGFPDRYTEILASLLVIAEIGVATALSFVPDEILTRVGVVVLSGIFAVAGGLTIILEKKVRCSCFGTGGRYLGKAQIAALIPWITGVFILTIGINEPTSFEAGAIRFASVSLAIAIIRCAALVRAWKDARNDRLAAEEMFRRA